MGGGAWFSPNTLSRDMETDGQHNTDRGSSCLPGTPQKMFILIPYKIGPSGEPIKNGLLGRFPTLRKDDADVESSRPPPLPPPGPVVYVKVGGLFSAFSRLRIMLKSNQKHH
jgi:hypothetical protein